MPLSPNDPDYNDIMRSHRNNSLELRYCKNQSPEARRLRQQIRRKKAKSQ